MRIEIWMLNLLVFNHWVWTIIAAGPTLFRSVRSRTHITIVQVY